MSNMVLAVRLPVQNEAPAVLEYNIKEEKSSKLFTFSALALVKVLRPLVITNIYVISLALKKFLLCLAADLAFMM